MTGTKGKVYFRDIDKDIEFEYNHIEGIIYLGDKKLGNVLYKTSELDGKPVRQIEQLIPFE